MYVWLSSFTELNWLVVADYFSPILFLLRKIHGFVERTRSSMCGNWTGNKMGICLRYLK